MFALIRQNVQWGYMILTLLEYTILYLCFAARISIVSSGVVRLMELQMWLFFRTLQCQCKRGKHSWNCNIISVLILSKTIFKESSQINRTYFEMRRGPGIQRV